MPYNTKHRQMPSAPRPETDWLTLVCIDRAHDNIRRWFVWTEHMTISDTGLYGQSTRQYQTLHDKAYLQTYAMVTIVKLKPVTDKFHISL